MQSALMGLACLIFAGLAVGLALLMTIGALLEYSNAQASYAALFWLLALSLLTLGIRLRQRGD
jgi:hypothetical protein